MRWHTTMTLLALGWLKPERSRCWLALHQRISAAPPHSHSRHQAAGLLEVSTKKIEFMGLNWIATSPAASWHEKEPQPTEASPQLIVTGTDPRVQMPWHSKH